MRFSFVRLILTTALALAVSLSTARAFTAGDAVNSSGTLGICTQNRVVDPATSTAAVSLVFSNGAQVGVSGGAQFVNGAIDQAFIPEITVSLINVCMGFPNPSTSPVTSLYQNGADGSFATDTYMGFRYTITRNFLGYQNGQWVVVPAGVYHFYVGDPSAAPIANTPPVLVIDDDVEAGPVASDTFAFSATDYDAGDTLSYAYAFTTSLCDASAGPFTFGASVTLATDVENGNYICAQAFDGAAYSYQRSSNPINIESDLIRPTVEISGLPSSISNTNPISLTVTFDEDVTGFDAADVAISGATVTSLSGGTASYTLVITPTGAAAISVQVPAGVAADDAGNLNEASNVLTSTNALAGDTSEQIASFMQARARNLIANQPSLLGVIRGGGHFNVEITSGLGVFDFSSDMSRNVWLQLRGNWSTTGTQSDQYVFGALGTHYQPSENLWLGMMAQFDDARSVDGVAETAGWGWLVGPYIVAQHPEQPLYFEASALYGQSYNTVSPLGTYADDFTTTRLLATARVTGEYNTGRITLFPNIGLVYTSDHQHEYTDILANVIAAQSISMTDFSAGLDFELPLAVSAGQLMLTGGAAAHYTAVGGDAVGVSPYEGFSASTELGLAYATPGGARYEGSARYEGIGNSGYEAYGVTFEMSLPF